MESLLLDVAGHRRSPATMPGYHRGRPPRNKGEHYPADPPTVGIEIWAPECAPFEDPITENETFPLIMGRPRRLWPQRNRGPTAATVRRSRKRASACP